MKLTLLSIFLTVVAIVGIVTSFFLPDTADQEAVQWMRIIFGVAALIYGYMSVRRLTTARL